MGTLAAMWVSLEAFVGEVRKVFDDPFSGREAAWRLIQLRQDFHRVDDYVVDFCTLAAQSSWNQEALFDMFLHGVSEVMKDKLAARELPTDLDPLIAFTIRIDGRLRERWLDRKFDFACMSRDSTSPLSHPGSPRQFYCREYPRFPDHPRESLKMAEALFPEPMQLDRAALNGNT
jgi:hypothetical protein